ncbi:MULTISPECIES: YibE/F family protein [unclassified Breznakia]|uniref:YibE/F family protein n=1 Tax=unclassified Breznakia TaxID=2623764 RepID=UPI0024739D3A|nr:MULTISPECIES: YibE/F family protein [unclassified Breznakia]
MDKKRISTIVLLVCACCFFVFLYWLNTEKLESYSLIHADNLQYEKATITKVHDQYLEADEQTSSGYRGTQDVKVKVTSGKLEGKEFNITNYVTKTHNILVEEGSKVIVAVDETQAGNSVSIYNYQRTNGIYVMIGLFVVLMIAVGGMKGLKAAVGLAFTFITVLFFTLPLIFHGYSPILIAIISAVIISAFTLLIIDGPTKKTLVAFVGTACGVMVAGLIFNIFSSILRVSGFQLEEVETLFMIANQTGLHIRDILFAGVLIAAVGALLDVAMSIASTLHEIHEVNPELSAYQLFQSGINVGKDMIGTMSNTLILAYAGSSFATMILFMAYSVNANQILNMDYVALEIAQALAGSIGIVLTVPFTSLLGAYILSAKAKRVENTRTQGE